MKELRIGKHGRFAVLLDDADYAWASSLGWTARRDSRSDMRYAQTLIDGHFYQMHRLLLGVTDPKVQVDHADRNGLNNQRSNIRACTNGQNQANRKQLATSRNPYKGILHDKRPSHQRNPWRAQIVVNGRRICLGSFATPEAAHAAYCTAARHYHGEFARAS